MPENDDALLESTETWFVRRGLPYFIEDRKATDDVFTRALPLLLGFFVINLMVVLSLHLTLLYRVGGAALGIVLIALVYMLRNMIKGEKPVGLPSRIGWFEIAGFVAVPPVVAYVARHKIKDALIDLGTTVVEMLLIYLVASALVPLARWAFRRTFQELGEVFNLAARALPLLFLFNSFLFISRDVWEFSGDMSKGRVWGVVGLFTAFTVLFLFYRLPDEVRRVAAHDDRSTIIAACLHTPMETVASSRRVELHEGELPLTRAQRLNVLLVLFIGQILQVLLLGILVFVFFVGFGKAALTPELINDWTGKAAGASPEPATFFGYDIQHYTHISIDNRLWQVSLFLAAVSAFFFSISSMTDEAYKAQFYERMNKELETAIQVRRVYLALYERSHSVDSELSASGLRLMHIPAPIVQTEAMIHHELTRHESTEHGLPHSHRHARSD